MSTTDRTEMPTSSVRVSRPVVALVHLFAVSVVWAVHLVNPSAFASGNMPASAPLGGISVPTAAVQDPVSYSQPAVVGAGVPQRQVMQLAAGASTDGIPNAALAAYQRAETVINAADKTCDIDWQLLAAVGRVESDHGRFGGSRLGADGVSRPGIYGIPLDGRNKTQAIADTDSGQYDGDEAWDRAVGPMQFIPATWSAVGVDADGDGQRDPQDINDAALAAGVYLCSGPQGLGNEAGRRAAVLRYNHSRSYADQVLQTLMAYLRGDYTAVPNQNLPVTYIPGSSWRSSAASDGEKEAPKPRQIPRGEDGARDRLTTAPEEPGGQNRSEDTTGSKPSSPASDEAPASPPKQEQDDADGNLEKVAEPLPAPVRASVDRVLTLTQAVTRCTANGVSRLDLVAWDRCINDLVR
ncbi:lytic transglycosylase domain-containing protein [Nocardioides sp. NBC_00163]|uniref:lytic transglycosylase domain-containing protein n=1 Tax=Nocardioides sp. NBC_00163 TaxID=2975999 RepID=UPI00324B79DB